MNKNKLVIISLALMVLLGAGLIFAGDIISQFTKSIEIDKTARDTILNTLPTLTDDKGSVIINEIKPNITIECSDTNCKWSIYQDGLIDSRDNMISRYKSAGVLKTNLEIENEVGEAVKIKLIEYADKLNVEESYDVVGTGTITFLEQK